MAHTRHFSDTLPENTRPEIVTPIVLDQWLIQVQDFLLGKITALEEKVKCLEKKIEDDNVLINELKGNIGKKADVDPANKNTTQLNFSKLNWGKNSTGAAILNRVNKEIQEKSKKENNIVISGIDVQLENYETAAEKNKVIIEKLMPILKKVDVDLVEADIKRAFKLRNVKKNDDSVQSKILVEFHNREKRDVIVKNRTKLNNINENGNKYYINPDLTLAERTLERELRAQQKERNGKLTETIGNSQFKYGKTTNGKYFYWGIRDATLKKIFIQE